MNTDATTTPAQTPPAVVPPKKTEFERFYGYVTTKEFLSQIAPFFNGSEVQAREFVRVILNAVQKTPDLLYADRKSLLLSCMQAARDRLMPDGKKAVLTVYKSKEKENGRDVWIDKVEYQPMASGMIQKLYDSGHVTYADACAVYEKDIFEYERGDAPRIVHKPSPAANPGEVIAAYLVAKLKTGETKREVIFRRDIDRVRDSSKAPNSPAWQKWPDQMAIKAVIKRGYKQLPSSPDMDTLIDHDNEVTGFADFAADMEGGGGNAQASAGVAAINAEISGGPAALTDGTKTAVVVPPIVGESARVGDLVTAGEVEKTAADAVGRAKDANAKKKPEPKAPTFGEVSKAIHDAKSIDALNMAMDLIRSLTDPAHQRRANLEAADKRTELTKDDGK